VFQVFFFSNNLKKHLQRHNGEKVVKCLQCEKAFAVSSDLESHLQKPFECPHCSKSFTHSCNLKTHLQSHTGEKPFKCLQCQKSFTLLNNFKRHCRKHTENTATKDVRNLAEDHLHKDTEIDNMDLKKDYELDLSLFAAKEESVKIEPDDSTRLIP
jgi:DNA-directed RNA polymerase subunit RPC12/RpoP